MSTKNLPWYKKQMSTKNIYLSGLIMIFMNLGSQMSDMSTISRKFKPCHVFVMVSVFVFVFGQVMLLCFLLSYSLTSSTATSTTTSPPPAEVEARKRRKKMERQVFTLHRFIHIFARTARKGLYTSPNWEIHPIRPIHL